MIKSWSDEAWACRESRDKTGLSHRKFNKKIARSRRLSTSGRWIAFFVKKIEKRIHPWYKFCMKYRREVINNKISKEIIKNNIQNQKEV